MNPGMSYALVSMYHADLRRQAAHRWGVIPRTARTATCRHTGLVSRMKHELGLALVEAGLNLNTRTGTADAR